MLSCCRAKAGLFSVMAFLAALPGCTGVPDLAERTARAELIILHSHQELRIDTGSFELMSFVPRQKVAEPVEPLFIFIEGDGFAWKSRRRPSDDPTPITQTVLGLMASLKDRPTAYVGRPCQFVGPNSRSCQESLWTNARYSEIVVAELNAAVTILKNRLGYSQLNLVGYSGGGVIAALIAARRDDIDLLVSIAAPMDIEAFTEHHGVTPLEDSLNPANYKEGLADVAQLHVVGKQDEVVPATILRSYLEASPQNKCVAFHVVPEATHQSGWPSMSALLRQAPSSCP